MHWILGCVLLGSVLTGCTAYGALMDTVTAPMIEGQMQAEKKRQAKGATHATPPAPSGTSAPGQ